MHQSFRRAFWALGAATLLSACGGGDAPAPATAPQATAPAATPGATEAQPAEPAAPRPAASIELAEAALRAQRSFAPAGDNAFELFIETLEGDPELQRARDAITDLFPYAVLHVEQRVLASDVDEARRVLELMRRAQPQAPALERLERDLERVERRVTAERAAQAAQAAQAARAAAAPPPAPAAAPPSAPAPVAAPEPEPEPEPAPPPVAAPVVPTPAPAQPASPPPAPSSPPAQPAAPVSPRAVNLPAPNYPVQAARQGQEGEVTLEFTINPDGSVSDISVLSARPRGVFDREAINAVRRSSYEPMPEAVRVRRTIEFTMGR